MFNKIKNAVTNPKNIDNVIKVAEYSTMVATGLLMTAVAVSIVVNTAKNLSHNDQTLPDGSLHLFDKDMNEYTFVPEI